jgi:hypothetical protein
LRKIWRDFEVTVTEVRNSPARYFFPAKAKAFPSFFLSRIAADGLFQQQNGLFHHRIQSSPLFWLTSCLALRVQVEK